MRDVAAGVDHVSALVASRCFKRSRRDARGDRRPVPIRRRSGRCCIAGLLRADGRLCRCSACDWIDCLEHSALGQHAHDVLSAKGSTNGCRAHRTARRYGRFFPRRMRHLRVDGAQQDHLCRFQCRHRNCTHYILGIFASSTTLFHRAASAAIS